jgi:hypothetical protein
MTMTSIPVQAQRRPVDRPRVEELTRQLLLALGEDPDRDGLKDTPRRFADWWGEFLDHDPGRLTNRLAQEGQYGDFVLLTGIEAWSVREHHLLARPWSGGHIPAGESCWTGQWSGTGAISSTPYVSSIGSTTGTGRTRASTTPAHSTHCPLRSRIRTGSPVWTYAGATGSTASSTSANMPPEQGG